MSSKGKENPAPKSSLDAKPAGVSKRRNVRKRKAPTPPEEAFVPTKTWYQDGASYWASVPATVDGVLGGFAELSDPDADGSLAFVEPFFGGEKPRLSREGRACDCGAGIGRVSKVFLLKVFKSVDLVEQDPAFLKTAETEFLGDLKDRVDKFICMGLQDFTPEEGRYEAIWSQWCLGHLTDDDLAAFFRRCKRGLVPGGMVFVKENITRGTTHDVDRNDSSVTRSDALMKEIFERAGLKLVVEKVQEGFPAEIFPVKMYALEPSDEE
ncbi:hypothetical protein DFJ74DRAFT_519036 [Hyaloraphidium curvatum]|nr:hypothetical protein DFJ74DRAFT_519036 [Hyaloraphidium curvatum]